MRDVRFGRIFLPTIYDDVSESVGDALETMGGGVVPGERRARTFVVSLPLHGIQGDFEQYEEGFKMRRALRSLMENPTARLQGVYFRFGVDPELNGWLVAAGADLKYETGGVVMGEFRMQLTEAYKVATRRTHRAARRISKYDTRLSTTPRDYRGRIFSTAFATGSIANTLVCFPVGATDLTGYKDVLVYLGVSRTSAEGQLPLVSNSAHGEVVSYEQPELAIHGLDDVIIYDRRGIGNWNLIGSNSGAEIDTAGWSGTGVSRSTVEFRSGVASFLAALAVTDNNIASPSFNLVAGKKYTVVAWVKSGVGEIVLLQIANNLAFTQGGNVAANGSWQKLTATFTALTTGPTNLYVISKSGAQTLALDDVAVFENGQENWLPNPSFLGGSTSGWAMAGHILSASYEQARVGRQSLKLRAVSPGTNFAFHECAIGGATAGRTVYSEVWVWSPARRVYTLITHELGGAFGFDQSGVTYTVEPNVWTRLHHQHTVIRNDRTSMAVVLGCPATTAVGDYFYIDAARMSASSVYEAPWEHNPLDPAKYGWEEVYGTDFPLTPGDVPVLANGLSRISWNSNYFTLETFINGDYHEIGRINLWYNTSSLYELQDVLVSASVVEWTPERGVIKVVTQSSGAGLRAVTYVTLQRGWTGPRLETYVADTHGIEIRFVPSSNTTTGILYTGYNGTSHTHQIAQSNGAWASQNYPAFPDGTWPHVALSGPHRTVAMIVNEAATNVPSRDDTSAYGSTRKAVGIFSIYGGTNSFYQSVRFGIAPAGAPGSSSGTGYTGVFDLVWDTYYAVLTTPDFVSR